MQYSHFHAYYYLESDVDVCLEGNHNCSKYARCKNSHRGYSCECFTGFNGDGKICTRMLFLAPYS